LSSPAATIFRPVAICSSDSTPGTTTKPCSRKVARIAAVIKFMEVSAASTASAPQLVVGNPFVCWGSRRQDGGMSELKRPVVLVTGVGRRVGIGAGIAERLAATGWDVAFTYLSRYDDRMPWGQDTAARDEITEVLEKHGARVFTVEGDFEDTAAPAEVFRATNEALGPVQALVMSHCESVDSGILDTTIESFDRHFAVNARAGWLLIKAFAEQYAAPYGDGRIVALTSDHTVHNLPYGAS
jgi:3-oxoacyl-[acyl-carrier protein] reductase